MWTVSDEISVDATASTCTETLAEGASCVLTEANLYRQEHLHGLEDADINILETIAVADLDEPRVIGVRFQEGPVIDQERTLV